MVADGSYEGDAEWEIIAALETTAAGSVEDVLLRRAQTSVLLELCALAAREPSSDKRRS